jgi:histidyl-tRNA synthetase
METNKKQIKTPQRLKGFNDFFGADMRIRQFVIDTFIETFEKYGYEPLETPSLEYSELMLGQSGEEAEKQFYRFVDQGGRDVMLKYEVMISMCRAVAQNINNITFPYKRYQIQRVWRAENVQKGRYREFTQCDADTLGSNSLINDAEFIQMGIEILQKLGFKNYETRISNRKFLEGLARYFNVSEDKFYGYSMSIDKLEKIGKDGVVKEMVNMRKIDVKVAEDTVSLLDPQKYIGLKFSQIVESFRNTAGTIEKGKEGLDELQEIDNFLKLSEVSENYYKFDPSIARGLASYTGPVWEYIVIEGNVGSVGGCGRYDKVISKYTGLDIPATGGSFGIERLCDIIKDREMIKLEETPAQVLVTVFDENTLKYSIEIAGFLRGKGINTLLFPDNKNVGKQIKYADKKTIPFVIIIGPDEITSEKVLVKDMKTGNEYKMTKEETAKFVYIK